MKAELKLFDKTYSSNNISESFEKRVNFYLLEDLISAFENMFKISKIYLSIPFSFISSEQSFSSFDRLKTFIKNIIDQAKLTNIAILHIESVYAIGFNRTINQCNADLIQIGRRLEPT